MAGNNRWFIRYVCTENPEHTWISFVGKSGKKKRNTKKCRKDGAPAKVVECRPLEDSDIPGDRRMWGEFICTCRHKWSSGNAWKGYTQGCTVCEAAVHPWILRSLRPGGGSNNKPHLSEKCGKCKKLGFNCRDYKPQNKT